MEKRKTFVNPIIGDKITFFKTCKETNGASTLCELELVANGKGVPAHYHDVFTETFTVVEGELTVEINKVREEENINQSFDFYLQNFIYINLQQKYSIQSI